MGLLYKKSCDSPITLSRRRPHGHQIGHQACRCTSEGRHSSRFAPLREGSPESFAKQSSRMKVSHINTPHLKTAKKCIDRGASRTHLLMLTQIKDDQTRWHLFKKSTDDCWSTADLRRNLKGTSEIDITVRPTELSKTIRSSAKSLIEELEQLADLGVENSIADDDPYQTPQKIGDAAMSKSVGPGEREAAQTLVQSASCSHGGTDGRSRLPPFQYANTSFPIR